MRILFVSNFYPPHHIGGYEINCQEVAQRLKSQGHEIFVLTSMYGVGKKTSDGEVFRWLQRDDGWEPRLGRRAWYLLGKEARNQLRFKRLVKRFKPDLVYLWNLEALSISIAFCAQHLGIPTCFYIGDKWLSSWERDQWYDFWSMERRRRVMRFADRSLRRLLKLAGMRTNDELDLRHVQFASEFLKAVTTEADKPVKDAEVVRWGIDIQQFSFKPNTGDVNRLLFVGQVAPHKAVHTAVEALRILVYEYELTATTLTIAGGSVFPAYVAEIRETIRANKLEDHVRMVGHVPHEALPELYRDHDVLIFPSVCDEGLPNTIIEAFACGLPVLATPSGGASEMVEHELTGLVFPKENAAACADHLLRLKSDPQRGERLRQNARLLCEARFRIENVLQQIECSLSTIAANHNAVSAVRK